MDKFVNGGAWKGNLFQVAPTGSVVSPWSVFALAPSPESLHVFWIGRDRSLWSRVWRIVRRTPVWQPSRSLFSVTDVRLDSAITGVCEDVDTIDLFWIGPDDDIRHARQTPVWDWTQAARISAD